MTAEPSDDYRVVILGSEGQDDKKMMSKDGLLIDAGVSQVVNWDTNFTNLSSSKLMITIIACLSWQIERYREACLTFP